MKLNPQFSPALEIPMPERNTNDLFPLGKVMASEGVRQKICPMCVGLALRSHATGEWGRVSQWDKLANDNAVKEGGRRILSKFRGNGGVEFFVVTEADRSVTTVCLVTEF